MGQSKSYAVIIPYREPTFELRLASPPNAPYTARYEVEASTKEEAVELAIRRFEQRARDSSVGWVRKSSTLGSESSGAQARASLAGWISKHEAIDHVADAASCQGENREAGISKRGF